MNGPSSGIRFSPQETKRKIEARRRWRQDRRGACVREICITNEVPDYVGGKEPSLWIIGGQEFDDAEPVLLILPVRLEIVFVLRSQDRQITFFRTFGSKLAIHRQYTERRFLCIPYCYLQGITVRPVPCNYYVIQSVVALSRRRRGSKSRRGRQFKTLQENCRLSFNKRSEIVGFVNLDD